MPLKSTIRLFVAFVVGGTMCCSHPQDVFAASSPDLKNVRSVVMALKRECVARKWDDPMTAMEAYHSLKDMRAFQTLERMSQKNWSKMLQGLSEIADDDYGKLLVLLSFWSLEDADYIRCQGEVIALVEKGEIKPYLYKPTQSPIFGPAKGFFSRHIEDSVVQDIITRSKKIFHMSPVLVRAYDARLAAVTNKASVFNNPADESLGPGLAEPPRSETTRTNAKPAATSSPQTMCSRFACGIEWLPFGIIAFAILGVLTMATVFLFRRSGRAPDAG